MTTSWHSLQVSIRVIHSNPSVSSRHSRDRHHLLATPVFHQLHLLRRFRRLLPHQMDARALGGNQAPNVSTRVSVVAAHDAEFQGLCGPSPVVSHLSDTVRRVFRSTSGGEDRVGNFRWTGSPVLLLAAVEVSHSLSAGVV